MEPSAFVLALIAVVVMGFAIQRGATCIVAAVEEVVAKRSWRRVGALAEAAFWSAGLLLVAAAAGAEPAQPHAYAVGWPTVLGGVLLGFGAWLNGACVFGTIARLGNGEMRMAATIIGYPAGVFLFAQLAEMRMPVGPSVAFQPTILAVLSAAAAALILVRIALAWRSAGFARPFEVVSILGRPWPATVVIGITYAAAFVLVGGEWTWMDAFNALPQGDIMDLGWRTMLFAALVAGAFVGGASAGRLKLEPPRIAAFLACLAGGALMAAGSLLIPGYNDGLILFGAPLLLSHAIVALASMATTVAMAIWLESRIRRIR